MGGSGGDRRRRPSSYAPIDEQTDTIFMDAVEAKPGARPVGWACLLTAGMTVQALATAWMLGGAWAIAWLYGSLQCALWALELARWFPVTACALDAAALLTYRLCARRARPVTAHAVMLLVACAVVAWVPYRVWWWAPLDICR
jgi:hypothetical protein